MNVTKLIVANARRNGITHVRNSTSRVSRRPQKLRDNVGTLCAALAELGVRQNDVVLILSGSRVEMVEAILAAFNLGAIAQPVSPMLGTVNILAIVERRSPRCCIFDDPLDACVLRALTDRGCVLICFKARSSSTSRQPWLPYDDLMASRGAALEYPRYPDDHPALLVHGSGSSGALKTVTMSHGALTRFFEYHNLVWSQYVDGPDLRSRSGPMVTGLPLTHLGGIALCLQGLMDGRGTFLLSFFLPELYLRVVEETRCSTILLVPSLYRVLLNEPYLRHMDKSALQFCVTGGEHCSVELADRIEAAFGVPVVVAYSMTECLSGIGHSRRDLFGRNVARNSCGKQMFGEISLRDAHGREHGDFGELWVRNATVHRCYADPILNDACLKNGWFKTGDLFFRDGDGEFFHRGRVDDMFICKGRNIYPNEIEQLLLKHPAVEHACAAPVDAAERGLIPAALVVTQQRLSVTEIQDFAIRNGSTHAVPQVVAFGGTMPLLSSGKVDRAEVQRTLQRTYESSHPLRLPPVEPLPLGS